MASAKASHSRSSKPITAYPLFPAFVAVWFGALFGLSSLAVGVPNLERVVAAVQLHLLVPAAAPPLGMTARALIALALTLLGMGIGFTVARLLARAKTPVAAAPGVSVRARDIHPDAPVRRPISAHEEFGDADEVDETAALDMELLRASLAAAREASDEDDVALPSFLAPAASEAKAESSDAPAASARFGLPPGEAVARIASADLAGLSRVELLERLAIAMQRRLERRSQSPVSENGVSENGVSENGVSENGAEPEAASEEGVAIFPAKASDAPEKAEADETEKALRDALAALHRMTGTG